MIKIKNNDRRLTKEFAQLITKNYKLYCLVREADRFSKDTFGKDAVITSIYRSPEEYKALYAPNPVVGGMPHSKWEGVDLRSSIYTADELRGLVEHLNQTKVFDGNRKACILHRIVGNTYHLHLQAEVSTKAVPSAKGYV